MLNIIDDKTLIDGTVIVQSRYSKKRDYGDKNIFTLDYEDYLLLKDWHFYDHRNGTIVTRREGKQYNLNRVIAWIRGYYDLYKYLPMVVKFDDSDKSNFSKRNLIFHFNGGTKPFTKPRQLYRGVYSVRTGSYSVKIPLVPDYDKLETGILLSKGFFNSEEDARIEYIKQIKETKELDFKVWI